MSVPKNRTTEQPYNCFGPLRLSCWIRSPEIQGPDPISKIEGWHGGRRETMIAYYMDR